MKKILLGLACGSLMAASCSDFHTSDNGRLDGFWQLTSVDTLSTGRTGDVRELKIFWSVQADLLEMRSLTFANQDVFFRFEHRGDRLTLSHPVVDNRLISDSLVTDVRTIRFYGMSRLEETFRVLRLDSKKMTLESERLRMYFLKF